MQFLHQIPSKIVVLIGAIWIVIYTLNPPRCTIDSQGQVTREDSTALFSRMFHHIERPMPSDGSSRQFGDKNGKVWQTTSKYDPAQLDWTRYSLGLVLLLVGTCSLAFLCSCSHAPRTKEKEAEQDVTPNA
jgi:hypothetical protein